MGVRLRRRSSVANLLEHSFQTFPLIALTAVAMGARNAAVRKLGIPDLTTTLLTLTITGIGGDSSIANGNNPRLARRVEAVVAMFFGAALGALLINYSVSAALWLATAISSAALLRAFALGRYAVTVRLAFQLGALPDFTERNNGSNNR